MSYQVLARKYRPQNFSDVIGQEHVTRTLQNAIAQDRIAHGYIFSGHRGIGKTTVARILAMALNCRASSKPAAEPCGKCDSCLEIRAGNAVDVIEIDAATNRGIDEIRELRDAARYRPARDRFKIYILDEAHQITDAAFNALLKTLEEPPSHIIFMMATTQPEDIPQTIRSRCQHFSFRAVNFEDIMRQLGQIAGQENISADGDALALLAEAGDGSMRDALSIMDQAIASTGGALTLETVRGLIGAAPASVLESVMQAVAENSSQKILSLVDGLLSEGHSPTHFARQLVRFLRNVTVAKIAGKDSALLQVSSDERGRVARVADLFSEEDLARQLQIMLRTHGELGYRQEQRFHLELGLLKMVHAQRLLPLEQLLSDVAPAKGAPQSARPLEIASSGPGRASASPISSGENRRAEPAARTNSVSPFAADSARKGIPKAEVASEPALAARSSAGGTNVVIMGSVVPAMQPAMQAEAAPAVLAELQENPDAAHATGSDANTGGENIFDVNIIRDVHNEAHNEDMPREADALRDSVLGSLADQPALVSMLETAEWAVAGNTLTAKVASTTTMIEMSFTSDARRIATAAASGKAGRPMKVQIAPGGQAQTAPVRRGPVSNGSARSRAEQDPTVRRMQDKFGAEIRTVIDYREKG
jgi:DNA polymerase-3 subunit gamma/tau